MKKSIFLLFLIFLSSINHTASAQKLSRTEKKIVSKVKSYDLAAIDFLEKVVNINSGTMNLAGVKKLDEYLKTHLKRFILPHDGLTCLAR